MPTDNPTSSFRLRVEPVGNLLNDNDSGTDQLGYVVYAQALAKLLHSCRPPITIGILAPWGNGKTFLLKHVQGLLKKYERQQKYDTRKVSAVEADVCAEEVARHNTESLALKKPKNKTRKTNLCRFFICAMCTLIFLVLLALLSLALAVALNPRLAPFYVQPAAALAPNVSVTGVNPQERSVARSNNSRSLPPPTIPAANTRRTATPASVDGAAVKSNVRLYLIIALIVITFLLFSVFCCCVSNTDSKCWPRFRQNVSLIFYAAFTRLPAVSVSSSRAWIEAHDSCMVLNFNDENAEVGSLDSFDGKNFDEVDMSVTELESMPTKYIFVNYQAWQYAGSDNLWAAIVTNLSDAIEKEFGSVCVRLFRMMQIERPSKSGPIRGPSFRKEDPRGIYVRINGRADELSTQYKNMLRIMKQYGVVTQCSRVKMKNGNELWWFVRFANDREAAFAEKALKMGPVKVSRKSPRSNEMQETENRQRSETWIQMETIGQEESRQHITGDEMNTEQNRLLSDTHEHSKDTDCCPSSSCCRCFSHFRRHPKMVCCGIPYLYCCILFVATAFIFPIALVILAADLEIGVLKSTRAIPIEVQIFSWLPATLGVFVIAVRFCWAMCNSQTERIRKALAGSEGNMANELGFMSNVKKEVMIITQLLDCVRFTHRINYKVVITIDDLDRCPQDKVTSVLEAVSILLSDRSSSFICLVAVDSRVAVKCIEKDMGELLLQANLTGHEYLKKIINLPFCLPEVSNDAKQKYMAGMMYIADKVTLAVPRVESDADRVNLQDNERDRSEERPPAATRKTDKLDAGAFKGAATTVRTDSMGIRDERNDGTISIPNEDDSKAEPGATGENVRDEEETSVDGSGMAGPSTQMTDTRVESDGDELTFGKFLLESRKFLHGDITIRRHICGNPRNMKRIFNELSLTTHLMQSIEEQRTCRNLLERYCEHAAALSSAYGAEICFKRSKKSAQDLVRWIVLTDQWQYRISYLLQIIEDSNQGLHEPAISGDSTLHEIYEAFVKPQIAADDSAGMLSVDEDPALLRSLLRESQSLTRSRIASFLPVTLNLDRSFRNGISLQRSNPMPPKEEVAADITNAASASAQTQTARGNDERQRDEPKGAALHSGYLES